LFFSCRFALPHAAEVVRWAAKNDNRKFLDTNLLASRCGLMMVRSEPVSTIKTAGLSLTRAATRIALNLWLCWYSIWVCRGLASSQADIASTSAAFAKNLRFHAARPVFAMLDIWTGGDTDLKRLRCQSLANPIYLPGRSHIRMSGLG